MTNVPGRRSDVEDVLVTIFDPFPVLTVTVESLEDQGDELHLHAGGQGVWIGRMAGALGARVRLVTALGGETGEVLDRLITKEGIELASVPVTSDSASYVHDRRSGEREEVASVTPVPLSRHELDELYELALVEAGEADAAVLAGPLVGTGLPAGTYGRLSADVARVQDAVVADLSGPALVDALGGGGIGTLKISHEELIQGGFASGSSPAEVAAGARRLNEMGAPVVVVTRGAEPTLALFEGSVLEVLAPTFEPNDRRGGGDAMTAALAVGAAAGEDVVDSLLIGAAAGALTITRRGLATANPDHVRRLRAMGRVRRWAEPGERRSRVG